MKLDNLKKAAIGSALGLMVIFGGNSEAAAQTSKQVRKQQQKVIKQQQKVDRQQDKLERQQQKLQNARYRVYRNGGYYQTDARGAELLKQAVNRGYQQGFEAGRADSRNRRTNNYNNSSIYRSGNYGYQSYVDSRQYQYYFRQGFERGYEDGFNSRNRYGTGSGGSLNILGSILQGILNIQQS
jgi:flagellar biosynthesis/type III secretory pathway protein FliH